MAVARIFVGALLHLFVTVAALSAHVGKVASGGSLRSSHRSSRASAFRAAKTGTRASQRGTLQRQVPGAAPLYVPKIGLANITEPTAYPPPPPPLEPWNDHQPLDTAIGHYLLSGFIPGPTITPPPTQESLDLAFACPLLLSWPLEVGVGAPDPCSSTTSGNWTSMKDNSLLLNWEIDCVNGKSGDGLPSATSVTTYMLPTGDLFGKSRESKTPWGTKIELIDCGGTTIYTVEEKIYKYVGKPNRESCEKYQSCDGTVFLQYFVKNGQGAIVAMTGYLNLFQSRFDLNDAGGLKIASVWRNGWDPAIKSDCATSKGRAWTLQFVAAAPGVWGAATSQWPLAAMMTMLSQRDETRQPNGSVAVNNCEVGKTLALVLLAFIGVCCCVCVPLVVVALFSGPFKGFFNHIETIILPKRMGRPQHYGN